MAKKILFIALALAALTGTQSHAQTLQDTTAARVKQAEDKNYISLAIENDSLGGGTDRFYTSGVRFSWFNVNTPVPEGIDTLADMVPTFDLNETTSTFFSLGHNIYTPEDIKIAGPQPDDRPWAAWLYGSLGIATFTDNHIDELELTLGVVGPEALGEQTQKFIHTHISNSATPRGWDNQLDFEPGAILSWQRRWPVAFNYKMGDYFLRAEPNINISLGNVYTYAGTGMTFVFGPYQGYFQDTPPRVRPSMPGTGFFETPDQDWSWHAFAGFDLRAVGRNIFLDGNTFTDSPDVDKKPLVGDVSAGVAFTYDDYRLSYSINGRSQEFDGQGAESVFGALTLTTRF